MQGYIGLARNKSSL